MADDKKSSSGLKMEFSRSKSVLFELAVVSFPSIFLLLLIGKDFFRETQESIGYSLVAYAMFLWPLIGLYGVIGVVLAMVIKDRTRRSRIIARVLLGTAMFSVVYLGLCRITSGSFVHF